MQKMRPQSLRPQPLRPQPLRTQTTRVRPHDSVCDGADAPVEPKAVAPAQVLFANSDVMTMFGVLCRSCPTLRA
jgi:hypothetical protein